MGAPTDSFGPGEGAHKGCPYRCFALGRAPTRGAPTDSFCPGEGAHKGRPYPIQAASRGFSNLMQLPWGGCGYSFWGKFDICLQPFLYSFQPIFSVYESSSDETIRLIMMAVDEISIKS